METRNDAIVLNDFPLINPLHPGSILKEELESRGIRQKEFAEMIALQPSHLSALIHGQRNITAPVAFKIEQALGIPATIWLNLQSQFDLGKAAKSKSRETMQYPTLTTEYPKPAVLMDSGASSIPGNYVKISLSLPAEDIDLLSRLATRLDWRIK